MTVLPNFNHTLTMAFIVVNGSYLVKVIFSASLGIPWMPFNIYSRFQ